MFGSYFKIAWRNLRRNRLSSTINIGGLAFGMAVAMLIGLWITDELTFDHTHTHHDRIAAVFQNVNLSGSVSTLSGQAMQLGPALSKDYGKYFKYVVRDGGSANHLVTFGNKIVKFNGDYMDPQVIDLLTLRMLKGNDASLQDLTSAIISESMARALFGSDDPMGKALQIDNSYYVRVKGVYADLPHNSSFAGIDYFAPFELQIKTQGLGDLGWGNSYFGTYVQLNDQVDMARASAAIRNVKWQYSPENRRFNPVLFLQPMNRWRLYSDYQDGVCVGGRIKFVRLYAIIGIFVLILACINFMNLSTARSEKRAKEVGIRKAIGSMHGQLVRQFFSESLVVAFNAFVVAIGIVVLMLPLFNEVADKHMTMPWASPWAWAAGLCFTLATGLLAGSYPALYLSSFRPVKVLKGSFRAGRMASIPRKVMVVIQFTVSVILVIATIGVFHQIQYAKDRPVGFVRQGLITVPMQSMDLTPHMSALRTLLQQTGMVEDVAGSESSMTNTYTNNQGFDWQGKDPYLHESFITNGVTPEFGKVTGWEVLEGRDFSPDYATDSNAFVINEAAAKYIGLAHPVGMTMQWNTNGRFKIIGVVRNMVSQSPYDRAAPMIFYQQARLSFSHIGVVDIRIRPGSSISAALTAIGRVFKKVDPQDPFEYHFADQEYAQKFSDDEQVGRLAGFFTLLAILISCLGLVGLSAFVAEQRTREIGLRKVLGASVLQLWQLLSKEFLVLVSISLLIGAPISTWFMHGWLNNYQYHAGLSWWIFAAAACGALGITLLTVSWQAIRAALANPVNSLRTE